MPVLGGFNPLLTRRSASQQVMALQGSPPALPQPDVNLITNPLFGRPGQSYSAHVTSPQAGPLPKLATGSGRTGQASDRSQGFVSGGYLAQQEYEPVGLDYAPLESDTFSRPNLPPKTVGLGSNGRELVGTYEPHDFTPAQRFIHQWRAAANWQSMPFGPSWRNLLVAQQVAKYNLYTSLAQSRTLSQNDYFAGYVTPADINIASSGMGASGGALGYR